MGTWSTIPKTWFILGWLSIMVIAAGCASGPQEIVGKDSKLHRYVDDGRDAYNEGDLDEAEKKYRQALMRAWAIDDPYESGTVAYNLAACLTSRTEYLEASDWLVDARVELCRAGASTGNTWLLSAEIAITQSRFQAADRFVNYAAMTCPPCDIVDTCCLCGPAGQCADAPCEDCCMVRIPVIGDKLKEQQQDDRCHSGYEARIALARARLAAKQLDLAGAKSHLARACELSIESCDLSLHADRHDVAALVHDLEANFLQAGAHRDREVQLLRCIGHYREIPNVLDAAARSYGSAERLDLAVDRIIRSARTRLARGDIESAWQRIRHASDLAAVCGCEAVEIRLSLTAKLIRELLGDETELLDDDVSEEASEEEAPDDEAPVDESDIGPDGSPLSLDPPEQAASRPLDHLSDWIQASGLSDLVD
ncbi:hypothetical protein Enr13x_23180 [Stieleria neptunia]|uniref:Tetratricopeptide repeat protein n=1 Tax=Stieleria neptunia TaxID=2527979 RepID=A0A518HNR5_9BACT|nr:hypothetical protein [Stieleria neptunia]QDV42471.1 hypothetical protein Enr13x_23180 [Stieleria neptunia]